MISRRLLRIKVLQIYYAHHGRESIDIESAVQELNRSVSSSLDLYFSLLCLLFAFRDIEEERITNSLNKMLPSDEDLNPSTLFASNSILKKVEVNKQLAAYRSNNSFNWMEQYDSVKRLWQEFRKSPYFEKFLAENDESLKASRKILCDILDKDIAGNNEIEQMLEENNIYWNDDLEFVISAIIRYIRSIKADSDTSSDVVTVYQNNDDRDFANQLLKTAIIRGNDFDEIIEKHIKNWELDRIAIIDRLMLHLAMAEFFEMPGIPARVTINEFIEISKFYSTEKSSMFLNGILEKIYLDQKQSGNIVKTGRGLVGDI
ncbi:MAG TPA: transcription antitermination factor NusB [Bacteroidales bacterium]|nr:transcription antitermination factor NusB [Bacteroidales bacterium]